MNSVDRNDIHDMFRDNFGFSNQHDFTDDHSPDHFKDGLDEEAESFYKYVSDAETPLYLRCIIFYEVIFYCRIISLEVLKQYH